jgi:hypothetical protein
MNDIGKVFEDEIISTRICMDSKDDGMVFKANQAMEIKIPMD